MGIKLLEIYLLFIRVSNTGTYNFAVAAHFAVKHLTGDFIFSITTKQVDILIPKNQALQILYLKHCVYKTT